MTKNEAQKYRQELASRFWNDGSYTREMYDRDWENVEIDPLDLSKYPQITPKTSE